MDTPVTDPIPFRLTPGLRVTLFLTSILWLGLWFTAAVVADHADSMPKFHAEHPLFVIAAIALWVFSLLAGDLGLAVAAWNLSSVRLPRIVMSFTVLWVWLTAAAVWIGHYTVARWSHTWPIPEILIASLLTVLLIPLRFLKRKSPPAPLQAQHPL